MGLEDFAGVLPDSSPKAGVCRVRAHYLPSERGRAQHSGPYIIMFLYIFTFFYFFHCFIFLYFFVSSIDLKAWFLNPVPCNEINSCFCG